MNCGCVVPGGALTDVNISNNYFIQGNYGILQNGDPQSLMLSNNYFDSCYYGATSRNLNSPSIYNNNFNNCFAEGLLIGPGSQCAHSANQNCAFQGSDNPGDNRPAR